MITALSWEYRTLLCRFFISQNIIILQKGHALGGNFDPYTIQPE